MSMFHAAAADMAQCAALPIPADASQVPLTYCINGVTCHGIPDAFSPTVRRLSTDSNIVTYLYEGRHPSGLCIRAEAQLYRDFPVVDWVASFFNSGDTPSPLVSDICIQADICEKQPTLVHSNGDTCGDNGYEIYHTQLTEALTLTPADGTSCNGAFPYMRLICASTCINLAVGWTGMWYAKFLPTENGTTYAVGQRRCHMVIYPGETMRTPRLTAMISAGDEAHSRNLWRKWYFAHILPKEYGRPLPPKLCLHVWNVDGPEFTGTTTQKQTEGLCTYIERGMKPDIWWIDAGWYPCNGDWTHTGTWEHDPARFPSGMGTIGSACEAQDVQFLVWFEPERVRLGTWLWENHPEWLIMRDGDVNALLDLGNPSACDWLISHVNEKIKEYHIHIYRQDFNFNPEPFWTEAETWDRQGARENLHIQGYLRYWDALLDANPNLWIDSCASGGRRNDLDTMRRAVPLHYTDVGYGNHPIKQKQHRLMFEWIPYFRAHNMSWDNPKTGCYDGSNRSVDRFAFHCALAPSLTNMTFYNGPEEEYETAAEMLPIWRRAAELELRGDYYPLTVCRKDPHDWYAMQFDDAESGEGFIQIIRNTQTEEDTFLLHMVVHNPDAQYFFENMESGDMMQLSGAQLQTGIPLVLAEKRSGAVWFYHIVTL